MYPLRMILKMKRNNNLDDETIQMIFATNKTKTHNLTTSYKVTAAVTAD